MLETAAVAEVDARLAQVYGEPRRRGGDPVAGLVGTILSQATTDRQSSAAFAALLARYPTWEQVRDAPVRELVRLIRSAGLANQKAPRIKAALAHIARERGRIELRFLKRLSVDEARRWLMKIAGVGPKTASIVLLFALGMPAFPVDTHIYRIAQRLGWLDPRDSAEKAHTVLGAAIPPARYYAFHINLIHFGREICIARRPRCEICPLTDLCEYYRRAHRGM